MEATVHFVVTSHEVFLMCLRWCSKYGAQFTVWCAKNVTNKVHWGTLLVYVSVYLCAVIFEKYL